MSAALCDSGDRRQCDQVSQQWLFYLGEDQPDLTDSYLVVWTAANRTTRHVEDMAAYYVEAIRKVQPEGPIAWWATHSAELSRSTWLSNSCFRGGIVSLLGLFDYDRVARPSGSQECCKQPSGPDFALHGSKIRVQASLFSERDPFWTASWSVSERVPRRMISRCFRCASVARFRVRGNN